MEKKNRDNFFKIKNFITSLEPKNDDFLKDIRENNKFMKELLYESIENFDINILALFIDSNKKMEIMFPITINLLSKNIKIYNIFFKSLESKKNTLFKNTYKEVVIKKNDIILAHYISTIK